MSPLPTATKSRIDVSGGVIRYPLEQIYKEVAYIAYNFHWQREDILNLEHHERQKWVREIEQIRE